MTRLYIIAGEASGDLHGSNLILQLHKQHPQMDIRCWGGDKMEAAGATLVKHYRHLAFMGFAEVLMNLRTILKNIAFCKQDILQWKPDALVLIDYPGFNLRIAEWAKKQGIKVFYYISPQVWAWKEGRVRMMKKCIDQMMVILPFEKKYFEEKWHWPVQYVGHPLVQVVEEAIAAPCTIKFGDKPVIALLPGSRRQEVSIKLPVMLQMADRFKNYQLVVAQSPGLDAAFYQPLMQQYSNVQLVQNKTYEILKTAQAALVTSGTATLETALFGVPQVVCYKGSNISYQIAKRVINVKYISLVNLIMDEPLVTELIQSDFTADKLQQQLQLLLTDAEHTSRIKKGYDALKKLLSEGGAASGKAAAIIIAGLQNTNN